jgi:hypothetical protein
MYFFKTDNTMMQAHIKINVPALISAADGRRIRRVNLIGDDRTGAFALY